METEVYLKKLKEALEEMNHPKTLCELQMKCAAAVLAKHDPKHLLIDPEDDTAKCALEYAEEVIHLIQINLCNEIAEMEHVLKKLGKPKIELIIDRGTTND